MLTEHRYSGWDLEQVDEGMPEGKTNLEEEGRRHTVRENPDESTPG